MLVEFAFLLPVFLLLVTGIFSFGLAISNQLTLTQALGTGAQYLQQIRGSTTDPCSDTFAAIKNAAPYLDSTTIKVTVTINGTAPSQTGNSCPGAQSNLTAGVPVTVSATYPCTLTVYSMNFASGCQLSAMVTEYEY
jgi:Flp pilus assembly protein TadG